MPLVFKPDVTNTGASTVNVNGLGAKSIQKVSSGSLVAVAASDLVATVPYLLIYNGTVFVMSSGTGGGGGMTDCTNTTNGFMARDSSTTNVCRTLTAGAGISITNPTGAGGNPVITNTSSAGTFDGLLDCQTAGASAVSTITGACAIQIGGIFHNIASSATVTASGTSASGTIWWYWDSAGVLTAGHNTMATMTCNALCSVATGITGFPSTSTPVSSITFTSNSFSAGIITDYRSIFSRFILACGTLLTCSVDVNGVNQIAVDQASIPQPVPTASGTSVTLTQPYGIYVCTSTCTVTVPVPAAGYQFCALNGDNVSTVITLAAIGSSARYENTARTAYGTAGTGTFVSGGAVADKVCILGLDATHYLTVAYTGTWTAN
jgi:hypothetical protein